MGVTDKNFYYYGGSLKNPIFKKVHEKNNILGGLLKLEGLDSLQI